MLISACYHTHKKASLGMLPLDGAWLVYPERSDFYKKGFIFVKAFTEFQGHSLLHCSYIIKLKSLHKTLLLKSMLIWTLAQSCSLQYPYYNEKHGFRFSYNAASFQTTLRQLAQPQSCWHSCTKPRDSVRVKVASAGCCSQLYPYSHGDGHIPQSSFGTYAAWIFFSKNDGWSQVTRQWLQRFLVE